MNDWKQAIFLTKFEIKTSAINILLSWFIVTFFSLIFLTSFNSYIEKNYYGFDIYFLTILTFVPFLFRPKHYQYQKVGEEFYASPTFIMMNQLPIPLKTLAKSRLLITFVYLVPLLLVIFPLMYLIPGVSQVMDILSYIAFSIIWVLIALNLGMMLPASDSGDKTSAKITALYFVGVWLFLMIFIGFFHHFIGYGIVAWTIYLAENWALTTIIILIIITIISWKFWQRKMIKKLKKLDYF